jgi:transcriptional regulator with GAF, ATPase, and Fis domain
MTGSALLLIFWEFLRAIARTAIQGIIGNRADAGVLWAWGLWDALGGWWTVTTVVLVVVSAVLGFWGGRWCADQITDESAETMEGLLDIDDSLLRLLPSVADPSSDTNRQRAALKRVITETLQDIAEAFGDHVSRSIVLLPRGDKPWLTAFAHYRMPAETLRSSRYYIGNDGKNPDQVRLAGAVFLEGNQTIVRFNRNGKQWFPDDHRWTRLNSTGAVPNYRAIAVIPIRWGDERLGVLCLDSMNRDMFDSPDTQELLATLGTRVAAPIMLFRRMQAGQLVSARRLSAGKQRAILAEEGGEPDVDSGEDSHDAGA